MEGSVICIIKVVCVILVGLGVIVKLDRYKSINYSFIIIYFIFWKIKIK